MKFIKTYILVLIFCLLFAFFGGWLLLDFSRHYFLSTAVCALFLSVLIFILWEQGGKIEQLENRVKELEEKITKT